MMIKVYTLFSTISSDQAFTTAYHYGVKCFKVKIMNTAVNKHQLNMTSDAET